jgi:hypothetical protein
MCLTVQLGIHNLIHRPEGKILRLPRVLVTKPRSPCVPRKCASVRAYGVPKTAVQADSWEQLCNPCSGENTTRRAFIKQSNLTETSHNADLQI